MFLNVFNTISTHQLQNVSLWKWEAWIHPFLVAHGALPLDWAVMVDVAASVDVSIFFSIAGETAWKPFANNLENHLETLG